MCGIRQNLLFSVDSLDKMFPKAVTMHTLIYFHVLRHKNYPIELIQWNSDQTDNFRSFANAFNVAKCHLIWVKLFTFAGF